MSHVAVEQKISKKRRNNVVKFLILRQVINLPVVSNKYNWNQNMLVSIYFWVPSLKKNKNEVFGENKSHSGLPI